MYELATTKIDKSQKSNMGFNPGPSDIQSSIPTI